MQIHRFSLTSMALAAALLLSLGACSKNDDRTAGQKLDSAVAKVEQKTDEAVAAAKEKANSAGVKVENMVDKAGNKAKDVAITTSIKAELARDPTLSALKIDVDTAAGRVALLGSAPDAAAKERATTLARKVDGVVGVDNQLVIRSN